MQSGYLPDIDETLETGKGICFDYAALMTAMLRTQRIPTRLVVGYAGTLYHAWISVYIEGTGWIDNIIYFDGTQWVRMDPTFAAAGEEAAKYVGCLLYTSLSVLSFSFQKYSRGPIVLQCTLQQVW